MTACVSLAQSIQKVFGVAVFLFVRAQHNDARNNFNHRPHACYPKGNFIVKLHFLCDFVNLLLNLCAHLQQELMKCCSVDFQTVNELLDLISFSVHYFAITYQQQGFVEVFEFDYTLVLRYSGNYSE